MAGPGGARPGAGRKPGSKKTRTMELAAAAAEKGITPIEVMLDNMRHYYKQACTAHTALTALEDELQATGADAGEVADATQGLRALADVARRAAQESAKEAAPYIHPKLQSVTLGGDKDQPLTVELVRFSESNPATQPVGAALVPAQGVGLSGEGRQESGASSASQMGEG